MKKTFTQFQKVLILGAFLFLFAGLISPVQGQMNKLNSIFTNGEEVSNNAELQYVMPAKSATLKANFRKPEKKSFLGTWYRCGADEKKLVISEDQLHINKTSKQSWSFDKLLFEEGENYKFQYNGAPIAYMRKLSKHYIEIRLTYESKNAYALYKKKQSLPDKAHTGLPDTLRHNWYNIANGDWILGLQDDVALYKSNFWNYGDITYHDGRYTMQLKRTDTVCYENDAGKKVCELKTFKDTISLKQAGSEKMRLSINEKPAITCTNDRDKSTYKPTDKLPESLEPDTAVIRIYIKDTNTLKDKTYKSDFEIHINDLWYFNQISYSPDKFKNGRITYKIPLPCAQALYTDPQQGYPHFAAPGDTILVYMDAKDKDRAFMGAYADLNRDISRYKKIKQDYYQKNRENLRLEPEAYKKSRDSIYNEQYNRFTDFISKNPVSRAFKEYCRNDMKVRKYNDLMRYRKLRTKHGYDDYLEQHPSYFDFIDSLDITNKTYWTSHNFQPYVHKLLYYYLGKKQRPNTDSLIFRNILKTDTQITKTEEKAIKLIILQEKEQKEIFNNAIHRNIKAVKKALKKARKEKNTDKTRLQIMFDIVKTHDDSLSGSEIATLKEYVNKSQQYKYHIKQVSKRNKTKMKKLRIKYRTEYLLANFDTIPYGSMMKNFYLCYWFYRSVDSYDSTKMHFYWKRIQESSIPGTAKSYLKFAYDKALQKITKPVPSYCNLKNIEEGTAEELLQAIAKKHNGNVVYIDVWAPWCRPCRAEMEKAPAVKKALKGKDVSYVYICGSGEKEKWKKCIKVYDLKGDHYYVDDEVYEKLGNKFNISAIPRYMIMNKEGKMVDKDAPRPSQKSQLVKNINTYLSQ